MNTLSQTNKKLQDLAKKNIKEAQEKMKKQYNDRKTPIKPHNFKVGDRVQYRNTSNDKKQGGKLDPKYLPLKGFLNIKSIRNNIVELRKPRGKSRYPKYNLHTDDLRPYKTPLKKKRKRETAEEDEGPKKKIVLTGKPNSGRPQRRSTGFDWSKQ